MNETSEGEVGPSYKKHACKSGNNLNVDILCDETSVGEGKVRRRSVNKPGSESGNKMKVDSSHDKLQSSSGIKGVEPTLKVKDRLSPIGDAETWSQDSVFVGIPGLEDGITVIDPEERKVGPKNVRETEQAHTDTNTDTDIEGSLESQPTENPPNLMINNWTEEVIVGEPTEVGTTGNQASEPSSSYPTVGASVFSALIEALKRKYDDCRDAFNKHDFLYAFIFGFLPTAWDVYTDISLGSTLEAQEDIHSAGLCWMFVCLPPCFLCIEMAVSKKRTICFQLMLLGLGLCFTASCAYLTAWNPGFFFYPAVFLCFFLLGGKILPVFIHTPEMKQFSTHLSHVECSFEASCQLVLIMHIWVAGGELHYGSMISSVVVIGKVSAENYLMAGPENLLADKSFAKRIALTLWYMPVFALTAFFRCGAGVVNVLNYNSFRPFSPVFAVFLLYCYILVYYFIFMILMYLLRLVMDDLKQLTPVEISLSLVGTHHKLFHLGMTLTTQVGECSTITIWGRLGRKGSRRLQLGMNTYYFLSR